MPIIARCRAEMGRVRVEKKRTLKLAFSCSKEVRLVLGCVALLTHGPDLLWTAWRRTERFRSKLLWQAHRRVMDSIDDGTLFFSAISIT